MAHARTARTDPTEPVVEPVSQAPAGRLLRSGGRPTADGIAGPAPAHSDVLRSELSPATCDVCTLSHEDDEICQGRPSPGEQTALGLLSSHILTDSDGQLSPGWIPIAPEMRGNYCQRLKVAVNSVRLAIQLLTDRGDITRTLHPALRDDLVLRVLAILSGCTQVAPGFQDTKPSLVRRIQDAADQVTEALQQHGIGPVRQATNALSPVVQLMLQWLPTSDFVVDVGPCDLEWHIIRRFCRGMVLTARL